MMRQRVNIAALFVLALSLQCLAADPYGPIIISDYSQTSKPYYRYQDIQISTTGVISADGGFNTSGTLTVYDGTINFTTSTLNLTNVTINKTNTTIAADTATTASWADECTSATWADQCTTATVALNAGAETDPIFSAEVTEAALEMRLTDVTNVFTNNDGALDNDDVTNDAVESMGTSGASGTAPVSDGAGGLSMIDIATQVELEALSGSGFTTGSLDYVLSIGNESTNTAMLGALTIADGDSTYTFPTDNGTSGQAMLTDGSGNLNWYDVAAESGGSGNMTEIDREELAAPAAYVEFDTIPATYDDLLIYVHGRADESGATNQYHCILRVGNGTVDTGSNYSYLAKSANQTVASEAGTPSVGTTQILCNGVMPGNNVSNNYATFSIVVYDYTSTASNRNVHWNGGYVSTTGNAYIGRGVGQWVNSSNAINCLRVWPQRSSADKNWDDGTVVVLYGITRDTAPGGGGGVSGPATSTDNAIVRWDGASGTAVQDSDIVVDDSENVTGLNAVTMIGSILVNSDQDAVGDLILYGSGLTYLLRSVVASDALGIGAAPTGNHLLEVFGDAMIDDIETTAIRMVNGNQGAGKVVTGDADGDFDFTALGGDVTGTVGSTVVGNDSHTHTNATVSSAQTATTATYATNTDTVDGEHASAFADASHDHNLQDLSGAVTDGQVPNSITIDNATSATWADESGTATVALNASEDDVTLADVQAATTNDFHNIGGTDDDVPELGDFGAANDLDANGDVADDSHAHTSSTVTSAQTATTATYATNADTVDGSHASAFAVSAHSHTGSTLSGIDISDDTNLSGDTEVVLTGDALSAGAGLTRDTEWDSITEINAASTDTDALTSNTTFAGDVTGTVGATVVGNDSHAHTGSTISSLDISDDTNLSAAAPATLTGDQVGIDTAAPSNGDTTHVPTADHVFDFCETTQNYLKTSEYVPTLQQVTDLGATTDNPMATADIAVTGSLTVEQPDGLGAYENPPAAVFSVTGGKSAVDATGSGVSIIAGEGGNYDLTESGAGGSVTITAGAGAGSELVQNGNGGSISITGGVSGNGEAGASGTPGDVTISGGASGDSGNLRGNVVIKGGSGNGDYGYVYLQSLGGDDTRVGGNLSIGYFATNDDDSLYMDQGGESLTWDDNPGEWDLSDDLNVDGAVSATTFNSGSGAMDLGDAAVANGDTNSIPTGDQVYDFCETTQNYLLTSENNDAVNTLNQVLGAGNTSATAMELTMPVGTGTALKVGDIAGSNGGKVEIGGCSIYTGTGSGAGELTITASNGLTLPTIGSAVTMNSSLVVNDASSDVDSRIESNDDANMVYVDAGNNRVGLRTATPEATLHVIGSASGSYQAHLENDSWGGVNILSHVAAQLQGVVALSGSRGTKASPATLVSGDYHQHSYLGYNSSASAYQAMALIKATVDAEPATGGDTTDMPGRLTFLTTPDGSNSPGERMRIDNGGNIFMYDLEVSSGNPVEMNGTTEELYQDTSSREHKYDIQDIPNGIEDAVVGLAAKVYKRISNNQSEIGLIAEDVENVLPALVNYKWEPTSNTLTTTSTVPLVARTDGVPEYIAKHFEDRTMVDGGGYGYEITGWTKKPWGINRQALVTLMAVKIKRQQARIVELENQLAADRAQATAAILDLRDENAKQKATINAIIDAINKGANLAAIKAAMPAKLP